MRNCLFCPAKASSQEHVIPAALGGNDTVAATCVPCNGEFGKFEDEVTDHLLPFRQIAGIPNRREKTVPSVRSILQVGVVEEWGVRHPDGEISIRTRQVDQSGKTLSENLRSTSLKEVEAFKRRARQQGTKLVEEPAEFVTYTPVWKGTFHFLSAASALRTAAKVSYICLARHSRALARGEAFRIIRDFIANGTGAPVSLFFSPSFAKKIALPICEHGVIISLDGLKRKAIGIVVLMGGLHYVVDLTGSYRGADYAFSYWVNGITGESRVTKGSERELVQRVFSSDTRWNDVAFSGEYFGSLIPPSPEYQFSVTRSENP